jgi:N-formylglutamate amidohydrolase
MCPILLCVPHAGTFVPPEIAQTMTSAGLATKANWFLMEKIDLPTAQACGLITSNISQHVVDLDCDPTSPEICLLETANRKYIYREFQQPTPKEITQRVEHYWQPFHDQLQDELQRMVERFEKAKLILIKPTDRQGKDSFIQSSIESTFSAAEVGVDEVVLSPNDRREAVEEKLSKFGI